MFCYSAYDLQIGSDIPLPELLPSECGDDVDVRLLPAGSAIAVRRIEWSDGPALASFQFPGAGQFLVRDGREVTIVPQPGASPGYLRMYVQGVMLAAILHQRGYFVLHASVVNLHGRAVALIGPVGAGKSSLASAFYKRGHGVIADDNAAVTWSDGVPMVIPAFPALKVYPAIAASLGHELISLEVIHGSQPKHAQSVAAGFSAAPTRLAAIFLLDREAAPEGATVLSPVAAITELIRHSVPTRWSVPGNGAHLQKCGQLAGMTPMYRVRTFTALGEIPRIVDHIENQTAVIH